MSTVKKKSQKQEKSVAKDMNARTVIASGALWGSKGDVRSDMFLCECKTTSNIYYSLTCNIWNKIEKEAIKDGLRLPIMCIDLQDDEPLSKTRYAVIELKHLQTYDYFMNNFFHKLPERICTKESFRISKEEIIVLCQSREWNFKTLVVLEWSKFLDILESGDLS